MKVIEYYERDQLLNECGGSNGCRVMGAVINVWCNDG